MTLDYRGNALAVGSVYALLGRLQNDASAGAVLDVGRGAPVHASGSRLFPVLKIADAEDVRFPDSKSVRRWIVVQDARWADAAYAGVTSIGSGTGNNYQGSTEWHTVLRDPKVRASMLLDTGNATSGLNCRTTYQQSPVHYLGNDNLYWFRIACNNLAQIQTARWGVWGGGANTPPATGGRPSKGLWLEFDRAVSTTKIKLCASGGSTVSTADTGITMVDLAIRDWFVGLIGGKGQVWETTSSPNPLTNVSSDLPSTANALAGRMFFQIEKLTTGPSTNSGYLYSLGQAPLALASNVVPLIPEY